MGSSEDGQRYLKRLRGLGDLYGYYPILNKILEVANDPRSSAADLANVFVHDHAFTAKILRLANSAYYSYRRKITTLTLAIVVMGFQTIKNLALSVSLYETFRHRDTGKTFDFNEFWTHSLATAIFSHWIAKRINSKSAEEAFLAGFLHDLGKLIITIATPDDWDEIVLKIEHGMNTTTAELEQIGTTHNEVGAYIADLWSFPQSLVDVLEGHERHELRAGKRSKNELNDIIYLANLAANIHFPLAGAQRKSQEHVRSEAASMFEVPADDFDLQIADLEEQVLRTAKELQIPLQPTRTEGLSEDDLKEASPKVREEYQQLLGRYDIRERQMRLSQDLLEGFAQTDNPEVMLMMLAEGLFREIFPGRVIIFAHHQKRRTVEGVVGYGVDWQYKIKEIRYSFTDQQNAVVASLKQNRMIMPTGIPLESSNLFVDDRLVSGFQLTRLALVPISIWGRPFAVVMLGQGEDDVPLTEEVVGAVRMFTHQTSIALERLQPKSGKTR